MAYSYGLSILNTHLEAGGSQLLTKINFFKKFLEKDHKVSSFGTKPAVYEYLKKLILKIYF